MGKTYQKPEALSDQIAHYCPGCTHGVAHRLVAEVIDELGVRDRTVGVAPVGCSVLMYNYFTFDFQESAHGRAPAMATGIKRVRPDLMVFTYQLENRCFSFVELVSTCPTNWGMTPVESVKWAEENMLAYYQLGEFKTPEQGRAESLKLKAIDTERSGLRMKISVCGKGGSGKSTVVSLLANAALARGLKTLVVDSDESNSGLFRMLGFTKPPIPLMALVGGKENIKEKMSQPSILSETEITLKQIPYPYIRKKNGLCLISIGKIHQALEGCACPMGVLSREFLKKLRLMDNEIAIVDMEAGIEHFGRGIDASIDTVLMVVEPSLESITLAEKIKTLASSIRKNPCAVVNKINSENLGRKINDELKKRAIDTIGLIPNDSAVFEAGLEGHVLGKGEAYDSAEKILNFILSNR